MLTGEVDKPCVCGSCHAASWAADEDAETDNDLSDNQDGLPGMRCELPPWHRRYLCSTYNGELVVVKTGFAYNAIGDNTEQFLISEVHNIVRHYRPCLQDFTL